MTIGRGEPAFGSCHEADPRLVPARGPIRAQVSSQQLTAAIKATSGLVSGYWLNIPGRGPRCPTCSAPRPEVGLQALREIL